MKAIQTKYLGPTDYRGARIKAWVQTCDSDRRQVTISYPHELNGEDCHRAAAVALCEKMSWPTDLVSGALVRGYVFIFAPGANFNQPDPKVL